MKKLVSLVLALCLLLGVAAISFAEEMPTLELYLSYAPKTTPDNDKVFAEISKITAEKIGCKVHLNIGKSTDMPLLMASNDQIDLLCDAASWNYVTFSQQGAYLDITDMLPTVTPALYAGLTENMLTAAKIDGKIYGVPNFKDMFLQSGVWIEKETTDALNLDLTKHYTLTDLEPIMEYLAKDPVHANSNLMLHGTNYNFPKVAINETFAILGTLTGNGLGVKRTEPDKIVNIFASPEYKVYVEQMWDWYNKGYIVSDVATVNSWGYYYTNGSGVGFGMKAGQYVPLGEVSNSTTYGGDIVFLNIGDCHASSADVLGAVWCIPQKSQYPEMALKVIELLNTDTQVQDLFAFGMEGVHYTREDGKVKLLDGAGDMYSVPTYMTGDVRARSLMVGETDDRNALYDQWNANAILEPITGFFPVTDTITGEIAACNNVIAEYAKLLGNGAVDPAEYLPLFLSALEEAGVNTVVAEIQRQYDQFLGK